MISNDVIETKLQIKYERIKLIETDIPWSEKEENNNYQS